jgi:hypothetical protein
MKSWYPCGGEKKNTKTYDFTLSCSLSLSYAGSRNNVTHLILGSVQVCGLHVPENGTNTASKMETATLNCGNSSNYHHSKLCRHITFPSRAYEVWCWEPQQPDSLLSIRLLLCHSWPLVTLHWLKGDTSNRLDMECFVLFVQTAPIFPC